MKEYFWRWYYCYFTKLYASNGLSFSVNSNVIHKKLTLWRPLLPYGYSYKASWARPS